MLKVRDLTFRIGDAHILNGISFDITPGEKLGIIGPNGSGKTTLFNCISGFNIPSSGKIEFKDRVVTKLSPSSRASLGLGRVFQNFGVFREMTVLENMLTAIESRQATVFFPWSRRHKENREKALEFLDLVKLRVKAEDKAGSLSGGQMRLLEIVRAIAYGAELFLLDEPTAGVSPRMKDEILAVLHTLQSMKKTVMIIEHDINFIHSLCDRIIVLDMGQIVLDGTPEVVRNDSRLQDIYFGTSNIKDSHSNGTHSPDARSAGV